MKAVDEQDPQFRNINASQKYHAMFRPGPVNTRKATGPSSSADDAEFAAEGGGEDRYHGLHGTRPDSAPSRFRCVDGETYRGWLRTGLVMDERAPDSPWQATTFSMYSTAKLPFRPAPVAEATSYV